MWISELCIKLSARKEYNIIIVLDFSSLTHTQRKKYSINNLCNDLHYYCVQIGVVVP